MQLVIPTHQRVQRQTTLNALPAVLQKQTILVASLRDEARQLRALHPQVKDVVVAPVKSIAEKRQWIIDNINADSVFMLDDDMTFFGRCPVEQRTFRDGRWRPQAGVKGMSIDYIPAQRLIATFKLLANNLKRNYAHAGISSRLGNDLEPDEVRIGPQRMMHALGYRCEVLRQNNIRFDAVPVREDFHVTLELLKRKYPSLVVYDVCVSPGNYGASGGCTEERTVARSDLAATTLARLHPGLVRVVDKSYKNVPRKEVVVSWKKAFTQ
jgi:hypothetical protein